MKDWLILRGREVRGERSGKWKRRGREEEEGEGRIKEKKKKILCKQNGRESEREAERQSNPTGWGEKQNGGWREAKDRILLDRDRKYSEYSTPYRAYRVHTHTGRFQ